jgi:hypothetical protein
MVVDGDVREHIDWQAKASLSPLMTDALLGAVRRLKKRRAVT